MGKKDWRRGPRPGAHRTRCIRVMLSEAERVQVEFAALAAGQTISDYVRAAVTAPPLAPRLEPR